MGEVQALKGSEESKIRSLLNDLDWRLGNVHRIVDHVSKNMGEVDGKDELEDLQAMLCLTLDTLQSSMAKFGQLNFLSPVPVLIPGPYLSDILSFCGTPCCDTFPPSS